MVKVEHTVWGPVYGSSVLTDKSTGVNTIYIYIGWKRNRLIGSFGKQQHFCVEIQYIMCLGRENYG